ncbi:unnamed protein product [Polarella glacialis]|uniref:Uncharacterized protein n=1 Tax=Polarella glacialis TaxID=89957 RepID=A0A813JFK1_POLGL|nr:unnamed protein product [Polarella glacialis]
MLAVFSRMPVSNRTGVKQSTSGFFRLAIGSTKMSTLILIQLLENGLVVKRHAANVVLEMDGSSHACARQDMLALAGNQSRYLRLDQKGCDRSKYLNTFRARMRAEIAAGRIEDSIALRQEQAELLHQHALLNANARNCLLRSDIRALLKSGAVLGSARNFRGRRAQ